MWNFLRQPLVAVFAIALLLSGCAEHDLAPVSGVVKLNGAPLVRGVVNFQPIGGQTDNPGPGSTGITDDQGRFQLKTPDGELGAVVGEHKVRIYSRNAEAPIVEDSDPRPSVELVPARYNYQTTLKITVPPDGDDTVDFDLKSE
jgi:hypothetical protein